MKYRPSLCEDKIIWVIDVTGLKMELLLDFPQKKQVRFWVVDVMGEDRPMWSYLFLGRPL